MFTKRKSKRRGTKGSGKQKPTSEGPKLWELSQSDSEALLRIVPLLLAHLEKDALEEKLLFVRKPAVDGSSDMEETVVEAYEEFVLLQKVVQEFCKADDKSKVLGMYGCHTWASVVKAIIAVQSPKKLLSRDVAKDVLRVADLPVEMDKVEAVKGVLERIPHAEYEVLSSLCGLLQKCSTPNDKLAFVFGNSILLGDREEAGGNAGKDGSKRLLKVAEACTDTMGLLITEAHNLFPNVGLTPASAEETKVLGDGSAEERSLVCLASVKVLYDYTPVEEDELALVADEWVDVLSRVNDDWLDGRYYDQEGVEHRGIFPQSYCDMSTYDSIGVGDHDEIVSIDDDSDREVANRVVALYPYEAQEDVELALEAGQVLTLIDSSDEDWWKGRANDGKTGLFPKEYVRKFESNDLSNSPECGDLPKAAKDEDISNGDSSESVTIRQETDHANEIQNGPQEKIESSGNDEAKNEATSSSARPPVPAPRRRRRTKRRPSPPPKPAPQFRVNAYGSTDENSIAKSADLRSETPQHRATSRGVFDRPLLHSPHAPVSRSAIPANRPAPVIRGPGSIEATRGSIRQTGLTQSVESTKPKPIQETNSWKIDQERFDFCVDWFKKLAKVGISGDLRVSGKDVAGFLLKSGLDKGIVARILELSDMDRDKEFDMEEFVVAHHLAICIKNGMPEPEELPSYLIPPSKRQYMSSTAS